jgi:hypothetical protein
MPPLVIFVVGADTITEFRGKLGVVRQNASAKRIVSRTYLGITVELSTVGWTPQIW